MKNNFTKYLLENGWEQSSPMNFRNIKDYRYEIFFDNSNQIELYFNNNRITEKYLVDLTMLIFFLKQNNLTSDIVC
jgi:hypothetical protein